MMIKNRFSLFVATFLIIGFFFLAMPEKGLAQIIPGCCINLFGCQETVDEPVACFDDTFIPGGVCTRLGERGECVETLPDIEVPTLSEWGLIAMAGILGIVGFMVIRRRKVTA